MNENTQIIALYNANRIQDLSRENINCVFENGTTLLSIAVRKCQLETIKILLQMEADVDQREKGGATPLLLAVFLNRLDIVKILVTKGASVNLGDSYETPLMMAVRKKYLSIVEFLVDSGANINTVGLGQLSPIFWVLSEKNLFLLESLLRGGIPRGTENLKGESPLQYAVKHCCSKEIIQCLLKNGADINESPLAWAAKIGQLDIVEVLIENGADSNQIGSDGNTPLATATRHQHIKIVKFLVNQRVSVCKVGKNGKTPLQWAVENEDLDTVKYFLDHGAVYIIDSVFLGAIATKNFEIVRCLHERGAYKDKKYNINDVTPLAKALQVDSFEIARYLMENGSTIDDLEDNEVWYLLNFLEKRNFPMVQLLTESGTNLDKIDSRTGQSPLTKSILMEDFEMVRYFIQTGANIKLPNRYRQTPLAVAAQVNNFPIFQFLVEQGADIEEDSLKSETMIRYYQIAKEEISKRAFFTLGDHEAASEPAGEDIETSENSPVEEEVKELSLRDKNFYVIEFD